MHSNKQQFDFDNVIEKLGELGKFQIRLFLLLSIILLVATCPYLSYVFTAGQMNYRCKIPECDETMNLTKNRDNFEYLPKWLTNAVPFDDTNKPTKCKRYVHVNLNTSNFTDINPTKDQCAPNFFNRSNEVQCNEFIYESESELTILKEFNLTCEDNEWRLTTIGSMGYLAEFLVLPICAVLSDKYGRKPVLIWTVLFSGLVGLIKSFSINYTMFFILEFITGIVSGGTYMTIYVMAIELLSIKLRSMTGTLMSILYSTAQMLAGIVAWYFRDFRHFLRALYIPNLMLITIVWLVPESVRWLLSKGKFDRAKVIILKAAEINRVELNGVYDSMAVNNNNTGLDGEQPNVSSSLETNENTDKKPSLFSSAIRSKILMIRLIYCLTAWFFICFIYYGMTIRSVALSGDKYLNYILVNFIELPATIFSYFIMNYWGRRNTTSVCMILCGLGCLLAQFGMEDSTLLQLIFYSAGKFAITIAFAIIFIYTTELFPTCLRHSFMNCCAEFSSLGAMLAPQTSLLGQIWKSLPLVVFGVSSIFTGLLVALLPETLNEKLPDTIEQAENLSKPKPNTGN